MLIVSRRPGEKIIVGNNEEVSIMILEVKGNQVRIGVDAPKEVPVHREEIYHRILRERLMSDTCLSHDCSDEQE